MIETMEQLMKTLKKQSPEISEEQIYSTIRHIRAIMSEWKLRVQSDVYEYLFRATDDFKQKDDDKNEIN